MKKYKIIFLNQVTGPLFLELSEDISDSIGDCLLITGSDLVFDKEMTEKLTIKKFSSYKRKSIISRVSSGLRFFFRAIFYLYKVDNKSLLFIVSNPPFLSLIGYIFYILRKQKYVILIYDLYPGVLVGLDKISKDNILVKVWLWFNRIVWGKAELIFTIGEYMARNIDHIVRDQKILPPIVVVSNWANERNIIPRPKMENWFAKMYRQQDKITIMYSGNIGEAHDLDTLLDAANHFSYNINIQFFIISGGENWKNLKNKAKNASNIIFLPYQDEKDLPYTLATADVAVISMKSGVEGYLVPSKTYYAMAAGSALLVISRGPNELTDLVENFECGIAVEPYCVSSISAAIRKFREDADFLELCRRNSRNAMEKYFSRNNTIQYIDKINGCVFK